MGYKVEVIDIDIHKDEYKVVTQETIAELVKDYSTKTEKQLKRIRTDRFGKTAFVGYFDMIKRTYVPLGGQSAGTHWVKKAQKYVIRIEWSNHVAKIRKELYVPITDRKEKLNNLKIKINNPLEFRFSKEVLTIKDQIKQLEAKLNEDVKQQAEKTFTKPKGGWCSWGEDIPTVAEGKVVITCLKRDALENDEALVQSEANGYYRYQGKKNSHKWWKKADGHSIEFMPGYGYNSEVKGEIQLSSYGRWYLFGPGNTILFYADGTQENFEDCSAQNCWVEEKTENNVIVTKTSVGCKEKGAQWSADTVWKNAQSPFPTAGTYGDDNEALEDRFRS